MFSTVLSVLQTCMFISTVFSTPINEVRTSVYPPPQSLHRTPLFLEPGYPTMDLQVGPSLKTVRVLCDSGSSALWINAHHLGSYALSQLPISNEPMNQEYGAGGSSGIVARGHVTFAGLDSADIEFGLGTKMDENPSKLGGIMGLARSSATDSFPSLMNQANKILQRRIVSYSVRRNPDTTWNAQNGNESELSGSIAFGATDPSQYEGEITYTKPFNNSFWIVPIDDLAVNGSPLGIRGASAILDSGSSFTLKMSVPAARAIHQSINGYLVKVDPDGGEHFVFPCDSNDQAQPGFQIMIGGVTYTIDWQSYNLGEHQGYAGWCDSAITGSGADESEPWLVGSVLFENLYVVFDWDEDRVGLAQQRR